MACTTQALAGYGGSISGLTATEIKNWRADVVIEQMDATSMNSGGFREYVQGLKGCTGTFECIGESPAIGEAANTTFTAGSGGDTIIGQTVVNQISYETDTEGVVTYSCSFTMCGDFNIS